MSMAEQALAIVVLIGGLVFFHELGHFVAAKLFKVKVLKFSLGFGPRVWGFRRGETEYQLAALPLGGFVKMAGEDPTQPLPAEDRGRGFAEQSPWKRAIIAAAGPAVNLLLPILVFAAMNVVPRPAEPALVGLVLPDEPGERAGLRPGDRIVSVDGVPTRSFEEMKEVIEERALEPVPVVVERDGRQVTLTISPTSETDENPIETVQKGRIGIVVAKLPSYVGVQAGGRAEAAGLRSFDRVTSVNAKPVTTYVELERALADAGAGAATLEVLRADTIDVATAPLGTVQKLKVEVPAGAQPMGVEWPDLYVREVTQGSKAWEAGLRPGDRVVAFGGQAVTSQIRYGNVRDAHRRAGKGVLELTVVRGGERREIVYEPPMVERRDPVKGTVKLPDDGFAFDRRVFAGEPFTKEELVTVSYGPAEALGRGFEQTVEITRAMVLGIAGLFTGRVSVESIGGPIMLGQLAVRTAEHGLAEFLKLFAAISINLGLVNLIPIPVLDGFHILVSGIEGISRRRVSMRFREVAQYVGFAMLLALMVLAMRNDIVRSFAQ